MRKRPGRKPVFTRRQVIDAALAEGIGSFTLRAVAERLGVKATALYWVFSSRQELQLAAMNAISRDIEPDPRLRTWQEALRDVVNRYWDMCSRLPGGSDRHTHPARGVRHGPATDRCDR